MHTCLNDHYCYVKEPFSYIPAVTFYFENSLTLTVYPHDYLFAVEDSLCFGWQNYGMDSSSTMDTISLGGSSSIKLRDEITGSVHLVGPHSISSAGRSIHRTHLISFLVIALLHYTLS